MQQPSLRRVTCRNVPCNRHDDTKRDAKIPAGGTKFPQRGKTGMAQRKAAPLAGVVMGSDSDWEIMKHAVAQLDAFAIANEPRVLSAHRMPYVLFL
jgi:hypothetical protein